MKEANGCWQQMKSFGLQVLASRRFMVFSSLMIMSVNGTGYMFGIYSGDIKSSLSYDQTTLNTVAFFKDLGGNLGILPGLIYEIAPPWIVLAIGSLMNFFGYFMIWLSITSHIAKPHVWQMCLYMCIASNAQSFPNTGALVTCVKNFPESRGSVIGILKGFIGLSGAIITQFYHFFYGNDSKSLLLLMAWLPSLVPLTFAPTIRVMKVVQKPGELNFFYKLLYIALGLAGFITAMIILQKKINLARTYAISALVVLIILLLPLAIVIKEEFYCQQTRAAENPPPPLSQIEADSCLASVFNPPKRGDDYTILQAILSIDMLIIFISTTCGVGGALAAIDNLGQIGSSLGYPNHSISTFISLVSIWNFLGRVLSGFLSETLWAKYKFPRTLMLSLVILLSCVGHLLIALSVPKSLYFNTMIMGFCIGAQLPLVSTIISEIFGLKHYSTLYNIGSISSPVGSYIFNVKVAGKLYDREALKQVKGSGIVRKAGEELKCNGIECYRMAFVVITVATFVGFLFSLVLVFRTRKFYNGDLYDKFRQQVEIEEMNTVSARSEEAIEIVGASNSSSMGNQLEIKRPNGGNEKLLV